MVTWRIIEKLTNDILGKADIINPFLNVTARLVLTTSNYTVNIPDQSLTVDMILLCEFDTDMVEEGKIIYNDSAPIPITSSGIPLASGSILKNNKVLLIYTGSAFAIIGGGGVSADDVVNIINEKIQVGAGTIPNEWVLDGDKYTIDYSITGILDTDNIIFQLASDQDLYVMRCGIEGSSINSNGTIKLHANRNPGKDVQFNYIIIR